MKEIKTKPVVKDIKTLEKAADVSHRMKNAYIRTKNQTELPEHNNNCDYVDDAGNSILEGTETVARKASHFAENYGKKVFRKVKESITIRQCVSKYGARHAARNGSSFESEIKALTPTPDAQIKTGRTIKQPSETSCKTVKKAAKKTIKASQKSVKTAEHTAKATIKASHTASKTAAIATTKAAKSAHATKKAVQAARMAARGTAASIKMAAKAIVVTVKATMAVAKGLIALIAAGGWIAVTIILVICLAGFMLSSVYGVFYSNESTSQNTPIMAEVISKLNEEFAAEIKQIQDENPHDTLDLSGYANENSIVNNWPEILAVYAVKTSANPESGMEVVTFDEIKVGILRGVFRDMNIIDYWLETAEHTEVVNTTDKDGKEVKKIITVTETILHVNITSKSYLDMIEQYNFNVQQVKMLNELMQDENQQLFMQLIGCG